MIWFCPKSIYPIDKIKKMAKYPCFPSTFSPTSSLTSHLCKSIWFHRSLSAPAKSVLSHFILNISSSSSTSLIPLFSLSLSLSFLPPSGPEQWDSQSSSLGESVWLRYLILHAVWWHTHTYTRLRRGHSPAPQSLPLAFFSFCFLHFLWDADGVPAWEEVG